MMMTKMLFLLGTTIVLMAPIGSAEMSASELETRINELSQKLTKIEAKTTGVKSAFSSTNRNVLPISVGQKVAFPDVTLVYGMPGYDPKTGVYTVPADGIYQFNVRVTLDCRDCVFIGYIKANGVSLSGVGVHDKDYYDGMTSTAIADLKKGDQVYLETSSIDNNAKIYQYTFSTFSGVLLEAH